MGDIAAGDRRRRQTVDEYLSRPEPPPPNYDVSGQYHAQRISNDEYDEEQPFRYGNHVMEGPQYNNPPDYPTNPESERRERRRERRRGSRSGRNGDRNPPDYGHASSISQAEENRLRQQDLAERAAPAPRPGVDVSTKIHMKLIR